MILKSPVRSVVRGLYIYINIYIYYPISFRIDVDVPHYFASTLKLAQRSNKSIPQVTNYEAENNFEKGISMEFPLPRFHFCTFLSFNIITIWSNFPRRDAGFERERRPRRPQSRSPRCVRHSPGKHPQSPPETALTKLTKIFSGHFWGTSKLVK